MLMLVTCISDIFHRIVDLAYYSRYNFIQKTNDNGKKNTDGIPNWRGAFFLYKIADAIPTKIENVLYGFISWTIHHINSCTNLQEKYNTVNYLNLSTGPSISAKSAILKSSGVKTAYWTLPIYYMACMIDLL